MSQRWAVRLDSTEVGSLGTLRLAAGAEVCRQGQDIWVRGEQLDEELARRLRRHPHARRHWVLPDDQLVSPGRLVPNGYLPSGPWFPLPDWLAVQLPDACKVSSGTRPVPIRLVPSTEFRPANVLLTDMVNWNRYGQTAPQVRLRDCFFAVAADQRVVIRGTQLPPLPGTRYVERDGIATAIGWTWYPAVGSLVLRDVFQLHQQDLALLYGNQAWERVAGDHFVRATRSAIRVTAREFGDA